MTDNEKIARWAGWTCFDRDCDDQRTYKQWVSPTGNWDASYPQYSTDAEAFQLLNVLVEKGYATTIIYTHNGATVDISAPVGRVLVECDAPTIHEAITVAVSAVIEKEAQDE